MFLFKTILNLKISNNLSRGASRSSDSRAGEGHSPETKYFIYFGFYIYPPRKKEAAGAGAGGGAGLAITRSAALELAGDLTHDGPVHLQKWNIMQS